MQGSLGYIIWTVCYLAVLIGLSAYGVHRYFIIYLFHIYILCAVQLFFKYLIYIFYYL